MFLSLYFEKQFSIVNSKQGENRITTCRIKKKSEFSRKSKEDTLKKLSGGGVIKRKTVVRVIKRKIVV